MAKSAKPRVARKGRAASKPKNHCCKVVLHGKVIATGTNSAADLAELRQLAAANAAELHIAAKPATHHAAALVLLQDGKCVATGSKPSDRAALQKLADKHGGKVVKAAGGVKGNPASTKQQYCSICGEPVTRSGWAEHVRSSPAHKRLWAKFGVGDPLGVNGNPGGKPVVGWVAYDSIGCIVGMGKTKADALKEPREYAGGRLPPGLSTAPCTQALWDRICYVGQAAQPWDVVDGVADVCGVAGNPGGGKVAYYSEGVPKDAPMGLYVEFTDDDLNYYAGPFANFVVATQFWKSGECQRWYDANLASGYSINRAWLKQFSLDEDGYVDGKFVAELADVPLRASADNGYGEFSRSIPRTNPGGARQRERGVRGFEPPLQTAEARNTLQAGWTRYALQYGSRYPDSIHRADHASAIRDAADYRRVDTSQGRGFGGHIAAERQITGNPPRRKLAGQPLLDWQPAAQFVAPVSLPETQYQAEPEQEWEPEPASDEFLGEDLALGLINNYKVYQQRQSLQASIERKMRSGQYDQPLARAAVKRLVKAYAKEVQPSYNDRFTPKAIEIATDEVLDVIESEAECNLSRERTAGRVRMNRVRANPAADNDPNLAAAAKIVRLLGGSKRFCDAVATTGLWAVQGGLQAEFCHNEETTKPMRLEITEGRGGSYSVVFFALNRAGDVTATVEKLLDLPASQVAKAVQDRTNTSGLAAAPPEQQHHIPGFGVPVWQGGAGHSAYSSLEID